MGDFSSTLASLASELTSLTPGLDAVDDVSKAISGVTGAITPLINEGITNKVSNAQKTRLQQYQEIIAQPDSIARAQRLSDFYQQLCIDGGIPTGQLSGNVESIPVEVVNALTLQSIDGIATRDQLYGITATLKGGVVGSK